MLKSTFLILGWTSWGLNQKPLRTFAKASPPPLRYSNLWLLGMTQQLKSVRLLRSPAAVLCCAQLRSQPATGGEHIHRFFIRSSPSSSLRVPAILAAFTSELSPVRRQLSALTHSSHPHPTRDLGKCLWEEPG